MPITETVPWLLLAESSSHLNKEELAFSIKFTL